MKRDLTPEEALAEAKRRWPKLKPFVGFNSNKLGRMGHCYEVGHYVDLKFWTGNSFKSAFYSSDKDL